MYIPEIYNHSNFEDVFAFVSKYPFGILITAKDSLPIASHLPFVINRRENQLVLSTHLAKANDQWRDLKDMDCLVVFSEPNSLVDATLYENSQNVPTWNYIAVHCYGSAKIIKDEIQIERSLTEMIRAFNPNYASQWNKLPQDYIKTMKEGIIVIEIVVKDIQSKWKLSQNKSHNDRNAIIDDYKKSRILPKVELADYMEQIKIK